MSRALYRFDYNIMKQQNDPCIKEFLHLVESQLSISELELHFPKDSLNSMQKKLLKAYNKATRLNIYYYTLYTYLDDHKEWCIKNQHNVRTGMAYTEVELELLYQKYLQYSETSEYIRHVIYTNK